MTKVEKFLSKKWNRLPLGFGEDLFYFKYSNIYLVSRINNSTPTEFRNFSFPSLPSAPLRMTKVEKFLSLSVLNSWFSYLTSHMLGLLYHQLYDFMISRLHDFTILRLHDFTNSRFTNSQFTIHKFTIHNSLLTLSSATNKKLSSGYQRVIYWGLPSKKLMVKNL